MFYDTNEYWEKPKVKSRIEQFKVIDNVDYVAIIDRGEIETPIKMTNNKDVCSFTQYFDFKQVHSSAQLIETDSQFNHMEPLNVVETF